MDDQKTRATISLDPHRCGRARARLVEFDVPVWAIIQLLIAENNLTDVTSAPSWAITDGADAFRIPEQAIRAAIAYYRANREPIDALISIHADAAE